MCLWWENLLPGWPRYSSSIYVAQEFKFKKHDGCLSYMINDIDNDIGEE
jgi:hypothetical protein